MAEIAYMAPNPRSTVPILNRRVATQKERRHDLRRPLLLECDWTRDARVTDLSATGCYVDTMRVPRVGEVVEFSVLLDGAPAMLRGRVRHAKKTVGFAIEFTELGEEAGALVHTWLAAPERRRLSGTPEV